MGLLLTTDRYPPITSRMPYPLRHAASIFCCLGFNVEKMLKAVILCDNCSQLLCV